MATSPEPISALNGDAKPAQATPLPEPAASNNAPANPEDATFETLLLTRPGRGVAPEEAGKGGLAEEATDKGPRVDAQAPEAPPADGKSPQTKNRRGGGGGPPSAVQVNKVDRWLNGGKTPAAAKGTVRKSSVMYARHQTIVRQQSKPAISEKKKTAGGAPMERRGSAGSHGYRRASGQRRRNSIIRPEGAIDPQQVESAAERQHFIDELRVSLDKGMNANGMQVVLGVLLLLTLFLPDLWVLCNPADAHADVLNAILILCLVVFTLECMLLSFIDPFGYPGGFFFWMDVIGTLSILLDITFIANAMNLSGAAANGSVLRAARVAKLGAKSGRLAKLFKIFKFMSKGKGKDLELGMEPAKVVSRQLATLLSQRVAALVMIIVIATPFLATNTADSSPASFLQLMDITYAESGGNMTVAEWDPYVAAFFEFYAPNEAEEKARPVSVSIAMQDGSRHRWEYDNDGLNFYEFGTIRKVNLAKFLDSDCCKMVYNYVEVAQAESRSAIILIILVLVLLVGFSLSFNSSVEELVISPLQRMMNSLRKSASTVLQSVQALDVDEEEDHASEQFMETELLEILVSKLARIVQHTVLGGKQKLLMDTEHLDQGTAEWIHASYTSNATSASNPKPKGDGAGKAFTPSLPAIEGGEKASEENEAILAIIHPRMTFRINDADAHAFEERVNSWHLDILEMNFGELAQVVRIIYKTFHSQEQFKVSDAKLLNFTKALESRYKPSNSYHNFNHGVDVMHTTARFVVLSGLQAVFSPLQLFAIATASLAHDMGHPGVSNNYLINTKDELALIHNDQSPLENMHCAQLYDVVRTEATNLFSGLSNEEWRDCREAIIHSVLGTDMKHHFEGVSKLQVFYEVNGLQIHDFYDTLMTYDLENLTRGEVPVPEILKLPETHAMLLEMLLHAADISNPIKPFGICSKWSHRIMEEFFAQGDLERERGLDVSAMCDRGSTNRAMTQVNFIDYVVAPLYTGLLQVLPTLEDVASNLCANHAMWVEQRIGELKANPGASGSADDEIAKLTGRSDALREKLEFAFEATQTSAAFTQREEEKPRDEFAL